MKIRASRFRETKTWKKEKFLVWHKLVKMKLY